MGFNLMESGGLERFVECRWFWRIDDFSRKCRRFRGGPSAMFGWIGQYEFVLLQEGYGVCLSESILFVLEARFEDRWSAITSQKITFGEGSLPSGRVNWDGAPVFRERASHGVSGIRVRVSRESGLPLWLRNVWLSMPVIHG